MEKCSINFVIIAIIIIIVLKILYDSRRAKRAVNCHRTIFKTCHRTTIIHVDECTKVKQLDLSKFYLGKSSSVNTALVVYTGLVHELETDRYRPLFAAFKQKAATWLFVNASSVACNRLADR